MPSRGALGVADVNDHGAAAEETGLPVIEGRSFDREKGLLDRCVAQNDQAFHVVPSELEVEPADGLVKILGDSVAADQDLLVGESLDDPRVVEAHCGEDVSGRECGADGLTGLLKGEAVRRSRGLGFGSQDRREANCRGEGGNEVSSLHSTSVPQRLKPLFPAGVCGTAEAVPLQVRCIATYFQGGPGEGNSVVSSFPPQRASSPGTPASDSTTAFGRAEARVARGDERPEDPTLKLLGLPRSKSKGGRAFSTPANGERSLGTPATRDTPPFHCVKGWATQFVPSRASLVPTRPGDEAAGTDGHPGYCRLSAFSRLFAVVDVAQLQGFGVDGARA